MKKIRYIMITFLLFINTSFATAEFNKDLIDIYFIENVIAFINSPSKEDLKNIKDENERYCETVYLEVTRRREYTEEELNKCANHFEMKKEQERAYMKYIRIKRKLFK